MYLDKMLELCSALDAGGAGNATTLGTYSVDLGAAKDLSKGQPLYVVVLVDGEAFDAGYCEFQVITDSVATLADTPTVHVATAAIAYTSLTLNCEPIVIPIGNPLSVKEQFLGIQCVTTGTPSEGIISAYVTFDAP